MIDCINKMLLIRELINNHVEALKQPSMEQSNPWNKDFLFAVIF